VTRVIDVFREQAESLRRADGQDAALACDDA
jgi:hypothetical protein